jgi:hypothetical protein
MSLAFLLVLEVALAAVTAAAPGGRKGRRAEGPCGAPAGSRTGLERQEDRAESTG